MVGRVASTLRPMSGPAAPTLGSQTVISEEVGGGPADDDYLGLADTVIIRSDTCTPTDHRSSGRAPGGCPRAISCPHSNSSSARVPACPPPP
ncbi:hypothetical protein FAIPA1_260070 [Frankia sp. AiPs1]